MGKAQPGVDEEPLGDGIWRVTLANTGRRNALDESMSEAFAEILDGRQRDPATRALVLQGAGEHFCAGAELTTLGNWSRSAQRGVDISGQIVAFYRRFGRLLTIDLPVVAAVRGMAIGAGAALLALCDAVIISHAARVHFNFAKLGLHPGMGSTVTLPARVGHAAAMSLLVAGEPVSGTEAVALGLATASTDDADVAAEAHRMAIRLAANGRVVRSIRSSLVRGLARDFEAAVVHEAQQQHAIFASDAFAEVIGDLEREHLLRSAP